LFYAAKEGHIEIAKYLIKCGANANEVDSRKQTPLKIA
jgi:ankyrin repeat protein